MQTTPQPLFDATRLEEHMREAGIDILLVTQAPNVQYLTRYKRPGQAIALIERGTMEPYLVLQTVELDFCLEDWDPTLQVRSFGTFYRVRQNGAVLTDREAWVARHHESRAATGDRWAVVARVLAEIGSASAKIGVDADPADAPYLQRALPRFELVNAADLMRRVRSVKSAPEIARLAEAARITDQAILESVSIAAAGVTQRQMARTYSMAVARSDATVRSANVSVGYGTALGNATIPDTVVEDGSVIRYDVGAFYEGYASDVARTFAYREARGLVPRYYEALLAGQQAALELIRPGAKPAEIFDTAVQAVRDVGIPHYERTHVGHGIGIAGAGYDLPLLAPGDDSVLEEGMVLCVETPYIELGFAGLQVEDMIVVTKDGYDMLTRSSRALRVLP